MENSDSCEGDNIRITKDSAKKARLEILGMENKRFIIGSRIESVMFEVEEVSLNK